MAGLCVTIAAFYSEGSPRDAGGPYRPLEVAAILIQASIYVSLFLALGKVGAAAGGARIARAAARLLCGVTSIIPLAYLALAAYAALRGTPRPALSIGPLGFVLTATAVALAGTAFLLADAGEEPPSVRLLARGLGWCCLGFIPLTALEAALEASSSWPYRPVSLDFVFYLALNVVSCLALARSLARDEGRAFAGLDDEKAAVLGLTERERAMAELIGRGLSNKEIASELGISPATVRTHIYNLYRKVGAGSRVELLNRLAGR